MPSRCSIAPSARPVKPMPTSARKMRRFMDVIRSQATRSANRVTRGATDLLSHRHEVGVAEQREHQVLAGALRPGRLTAPSVSFAFAFNSARVSFEQLASVAPGTSATRPVPRSRGGRPSTCSNATRTNASSSGSRRAESLLRQHAAQPQGQFAVGQRERLLRQHGGRSPVGVARIGGVEEFEELHSRLAVVREVETAPARDQSLILRRSPGRPS